MKDERTKLASIDKPWMRQYEKYDASNEPKFITDKTVWDVAEKLLEKYSSINFIEYFGRNISRETFAAYVEMWAKTFRALDVKPNEIVPIYTPASPEAFAMFFALNAIGACPYYQKLAITKEALEEETKGAKIAVIFDALWKDVKDVYSQDRFKKVIVISVADSMMFPLKQIFQMKSFFEKRKSDCRIPETAKYIWTNDVKKIASSFTGNYKVPFEAGRIAAITTSSGTTSNAVKGIMDSNEGILASLTCTLNAETGFTEGKRTLTWLPATASTSLNCLQLLPTFTGGTIIFDPRADISMRYSQIMKNRPNITIAAGSVWERFIQDLLADEKKTGKIRDLSWIDYFIMGGFGTTPDILNDINATIKERGASHEIFVGYGFSEVFGVLSVVKYKGKYKAVENDKQVLSVGIPLPGYVVGIFDENGVELPYGEGVRGELWIKAPSNMEGYYNQPELTKSTIIDGWIHSGDLCEIDNEGNIYCYGRLKNHIIVHGKKEYLFDLSNDIRDQFNLYDIMLERKKLSDGNDSLNIYFVQKREHKTDSIHLIRSIDDFLRERNVSIDGYKEFDTSLPVDPTTMKPRTFDTTGFVKYKNNKIYSLSYIQEELDTYKLVEDER